MNPYFFCRFDRRPADINDDMMVVFQATNEFDDASFSNEIEREVARALEPDELIYLVRQSSFDAAKEALSRSSGIKRIEKRTRVVVVGYGPDGSEAGKMKLSGNGEPSSITLDEIRRRCGTAIFLDRHGFMEANASFHFENPSGNHTDRFIRLSNILVRQAEIAFLGFTILPLIPSEVDHVYIDTPSLFAVVASANEQLKSLVSGRRDLLADNFRSYDGVDDYDFTHLSQAVALVSASASGSLAGRLMKRGFVADRIGHVLYLSDKPAKTKVAINLSSDAMTNPDGLTGSRNMYSKEECQLCKDGSHPVPLRGDQFDIAAPQPFPLVLKRKHAPVELKLTIGRLLGTRALTAAIPTGSDGLRAYNIDVEKLFDGQAYRERFDYFVKRYVPGRVSQCISVGEDAELVVKHIKEILASDICVYDHQNIAQLAKDRKNSSHALRPILVVAGAIETGRGLLDISRDLRDICQDAPLVYLAAFAKIPNIDRSQILRENLTLTSLPVPHLFEYVDHLILPVKQDSNAWRSELDFLQRTKSFWEQLSGGALDKRVYSLKKTSEPLRDDLFVANDSNIKLELREGFAFWSKGYKDQTQADVFYTISSVLQQLRANAQKGGDDALYAGWYRHTLLSSENFSRFNDGIIQASLLRAASPPEIDYRNDPDSAEQMVRIIRKIVERSVQSRGESAAEFLIAIGSKRLALRQRDYKKVLAEFEGLPPIVEALRVAARSEVMPTAP